jgi:hypothetical protein
VRMASLVVNDYTNYEERMAAAVAHARRVLDSSRLPVLPAACPHSYADKFSLAERASNGTLAALVNVLEAMGLSGAGLEQAVAWSAGGAKSVVLRLEGSESCSFVRSVTRKEEGKTEQQSTFGGIKSTFKTVTTVDEHYFLLVSSFRLSLVPGGELSRALVLQEREGRMEAKVLVKEQPPRPPKSERPTLEVELSGLLGLLKGRQGVFAVDRAHAKCLTPRRNPQAQRFAAAAQAVSRWCALAHNFFSQLVALERSLSPNRTWDDAAAEQATRELFIPVLPLFQDPEAGPRREQGAELVSLDDVDRFLQLHREQLQARLRAVADTAVSLSKGGATSATPLLASAQELALLHLSLHLRAVVDTGLAALEHVEQLLMRQLAAAIGKEVSLELVEEYMRFHYRRLLAAGVARPFFYDVKRPGFAPEGSLSIEPLGGGPEAVTFFRERGAGAAPPMRFALSAAAQVEMRGSQCVHGLVRQTFAGAAPPALALVARARQFSCFVLMVGSVPARGTFEPRHAVILTNKDRMVLPLVLEAMPTAKQFRDAIESLSPEQQAFCKAVRSMQLASTLFAVAVVEIKPQMELLLRLPKGSLTKEIKLTQDLIRLFIEFQVPCDLVTYDGDEAAPPADKIAAVRGHVAKIVDMVEASKKQQAEEQKQRALDAVHHRVESEMEDHDSYTLTAAGFGADDAPQMPQMRSLSKSGGGMPMPPMPSLRFRGGPPAGAVAKRAAAPAPMMMMAAMASAPPQLECMPPPPPAPAPAPAPAQPNRQLAPQSAQQPQVGKVEAVETAEASSEADYTQLPTALEARIEAFDPDSKLAPTKISVQGGTLERFRGLLAQTSDQEFLDEASFAAHKSRAMDLLDALTRSGDLPLVETQLHVVVATTQLFEHTVLDTIVKNNVNPIAAIECSALLVAAQVTGKPVHALLASPQDQVRLLEAEPALFAQIGDAAPVAAQLRP